MAQYNLPVTELDFDDIKSNLKKYMKSQSEFSDYNFEGSGLSTLIDLLAYNTHYLAMNANMLANEMFLDSAVLRSSVVSHAKQLNYIPRSVRAPVAYLNVTVNNSALSTVTIQKGTKFTTKVNNKSYGFVVNATQTTTNQNGLLRFVNLPVYEGTLTTTKYTVDNSNPEKRFLLTSDRADTTTLKVTVQTSTSDTTQRVFNLARDISVVTATDEVYFLQEVEDGRFEVYFGDNVIGQKLNDGNIVILEYVVTNKGESNGASTFSGTSVGGETDITIETLAEASGGAERETIQSIKYYAPLNYSAQRRAVTSYDYKSILPEIYPNIRSVQVWGGEDNDPPVYGQVYVSISPLSGAFLTEAQKQFIVNELSSYNVASVRPVIVDPETINIRLDVSFRYNPLVTSKSVADLETLVSETIQNYSSNNLEKFDQMFRFSELGRLIDDTDASILSNITNVRMYKNQRVQLNTTTQYIINFYNPIYSPHLGEPPVTASTGFKIQGSDETHYLDDYNGVMRLYTIVATNRVYQNTNVGTVDYDTGKIVINDLNVTETVNANNTIEIIAIPESNDVIPVRNQLLSIDVSGSNIAGGSDNSGSGFSPSSHSIVGTFGPTTTGTATMTTGSSTSTRTTTSSSSSGNYNL